MLNDNEKTIVTLRSKQGVPKTYKQIRKRVLHELNLFLRRVREDSPGFQLGVDFSKGESSINLSGLFREDGLIGMLEASNFENIDQVSPFLGAVTYVFSVNEATADTTKISTKYSNLLMILNRKHGSWLKRERAGRTQLQLQGIQRERKSSFWGSSSVFHGHKKVTCPIIRGGTVWSWCH